MCASLSEAAGGRGVIAPASLPLALRIEAVDLVVLAGRLGRLGRLDGRGPLRLLPVGVVERPVVVGEGGGGAERERGGEDRVADHGHLLEVGLNDRGAAVSSCTG